MSFIMTLTAAERDAVLAMRQKSGKHVFFGDDGEPVAAPAAPLKKKRTLSEEHKKKLQEAAALARAKKAGEKARLAAENKAELRALVDASDRAALCAAPAGTSSALPEPAPAAEKPKATRSELPADATPEQKELWEKSGQELRDIYHPLIGKKVGLKTSSTAPTKLALVTEITRLRAAGHTAENPAKTGKGE